MSHLKKYDVGGGGGDKGALTKHKDISTIFPWLWLLGTNYMETHMGVKKIETG